jgi:hypothetical protein
MTYALIVDDAIVNIVVWDGVSPFDPGGTLTPLSDLPSGVGMGWRFVGGEWLPPELVG